MRRITFTVALTLAPALALAQSQAVVKTDTKATAGVQTRKVDASADASSQMSVSRKPRQEPAQEPAEFSAEGRAKLEALFERARRDSVPTAPMRNRIAEGQVKGATEVQIIAQTGKVLARLDATHDAMVRAGRPQPADSEVSRGAEAMEQGVTSAQIEAVVKRAPSDRSLTVAFEVLATLAARGVSSSQAVAQIESKFDARASDQSIASLTAQTTGSLAGGVGSGTSGARSGGTAAGNATAGANAATKGAGSASGTVTGTVTGVIKKP